MRERHAVNQLYEGLCSCVSVHLYGAASVQGS